MDHLALVRGIDKNSNILITKLSVRVLIIIYKVLETLKQIVHDGWVTHVFDWFIWNHNFGKTHHMIFIQARGLHVPFLRILIALWIERSHQLILKFAPEFILQGATCHTFFTALYSFNWLNQSDYTCRSYLFYEIFIVRKHEVHSNLVKHDEFVGCIYLNAFFKNT